MNWRKLILIAMSIASPCFGEVITFENLPNQYFLSAPGGGVNIGSFYSGLNFGPSVTALSVTRFGGFNDAGYPPHSGDVVVFDAFDDTVSILFAANQLSVGIYYTSLDPVVLSAFDAHHVLIGSADGAANTDGSAGTSDPLFVNAEGIRSVTLTGIAGDFVFDDVTYTPAHVAPEPSAVPMLLGAFVLLFRRRN